VCECVCVCVCLYMCVCDLIIDGFLQVGVSVCCFSVSDPHTEKHALSAYFILEPIDPNARIGNNHDCVNLCFLVKLVLLSR
jgi:hypothetical protein